jgi:DNA-directed RNA polymerase specialized sigma24 family protein
VRALWQSLHAHLLQSLEFHSARKQFGAVRQERPALKRYSDQFALLDFLHSKDGDQGEKNGILEALVNEAQDGGAGAQHAVTLLWLGLWPGLDGLYRRLWRHFRQAPDELVSAISEQFTVAVHRADLSGIRRLAATLLLNVERDIRCGLRRAWAERNLQVDLPEPDDLDALMHGRACRSSHLGLPPGASTDDETGLIRNYLARLVGVDADLVVAVVILGEGQYEAANRLGISHDAARKRYQRAIQRIRIEIEKPDNGVSNFANQRRVSFLSGSDQPARDHGSHV